jgi:hypothetical protein
MRRQPRRHRLPRRFGFSHCHLATRSATTNLKVNSKPADGSKHLYNQHCVLSVKERSSTRYAATRRHVLFFCPTSSAAALQTINGDNEVRSLKHLDQPAH